MLICTYAQTGQLEKMKPVRSISISIPLSATTKDYSPTEGTIFSILFYDRKHIHYTPLAPTHTLYDFNSVLGNS